jgi:hypothetical protein
VEIDMDLWDDADFASMNRVVGNYDLTGSIKVSRASVMDKAIKARVLLNGVPIHEEVINPRAEAQFSHPIQVKIPSDELHANGVPKYPNGAYTVTVEVINESNILVKSESRQYGFDNTDRGEATLIFENPTGATDANGVTWRGGSLTIQAKYTFFTQGRNATEAKFDVNHPIASVSMSAPHTAGTAQIIADALKAPPAGIKGLTIRPEQMKVTVVTNQGPLNVSLLPYFIDNEAPKISLSDDASGFSGTPVLTNVRRFAIPVTDEGSGVPAQPVLGSVTRVAPGVTGPAICAVGQYDVTDITNSCKPIRLGNEILLPEDEGFFTFTGRGVDNVGNTSSNLLTLRSIRDGQAPTISSPSVTLASNGDALFNFTVNDNLSPASATAFYRFPYGTGTIALGTTDYQPLSEYEELESELVAQFAARWIASVQLSQSSGLVATAPAQVLNYIVEAVDHAGNRALADVPRLDRPAGRDARLRGVQTLSATASAQAVCSRNATRFRCPSDVAEEVNITIRATTSATVTTSPFGSTFIWVRDPAAQRFFLEGTSSQPTSTVSGDVRTWTWTIPFRADGYGAQNQAGVLAGGLHADGGLVLSYPAFVNIIEGS